MSDSLTLTNPLVDLGFVKPHFLGFDETLSQCLHHVPLDSRASSQTAFRKQDENNMNEVLQL